MAAITAKDTKPEKMVRSMLHALGYRFRLHRKDLPGTPDIVLPKHGTAIFVHGCFWHCHQGCKESRLPETNTEKWRKKFVGNIERDKRNVKALRGLGWNVLVIWECEAKDPGLLKGLIKEQLPVKI